MIRSFFDTDLYKITMGQVVLNQFPEVEVVYQFINRNKTPFPKGFAGTLKRYVERCLPDMRPDKSEIGWLKANVRYLKHTYLDWLKGYQFDPAEVRIEQEDGNLAVVVSGPWYRTIYWEVPLLAVISELYYEESKIKPCKDWEERIDQKGEILTCHGCHWADFGTRRRFSYDVQDEVCRHFHKLQGFLGTSNPCLAMKYNVRPMGTYAHEAVMAMQVRHGFNYCNAAWMEAWVKEYQGDLGIALPDTVTTDYFLKHQFNMMFSKLFDGIRHDSGDPFEFGEKVIKHYQGLGIDSRSKRLVFSDGLNAQKLVELNHRFNDRIMVSGGIGTNLSNDVGAKPLNIVMKLTHADFGWGPVATVKLSDEPGKYTGDEARIKRAKEDLKI